MKWLGGLPKAVQDWLPEKWREPDERVQDQYDFHLQFVFNSESGRFLLGRWLADSYCQMSYTRGLSPADTAYNEGFRAFIHEILLDLDRIENKKKLVMEPEDAQLSQER